MPVESISPFSPTGFSMITLTKRVNRVGYSSHFLDKLGLFKDVPIKTTTFATEDLAISPGFVPVTARGSAATPYASPKRKDVLFQTQRIAESVDLTADMVQNIRAGIDDIQVSELSVELSNVLDTLANQLRNLRENHHELTFEKWRIQSLIGTLYDSDNSTVIYNWFTEFNQSAQSVDFAFATSDDKAIKCHSATNKLANVASNLDYKPVALCDPIFFDRLTTNASVKASYQNRVIINYNQDPLIQNMYEKGFYFQGILFVVPYTNKIAGIDLIADKGSNPANGTAYLFPFGADNLYRIMAPADYMECVNTPGMPVYAKMAPDPSGMNRFMKCELNSQGMMINTRPEATIQLTSSN